MTRLHGFDALNLAGALEKLQAARTSLEVITPHDARLAKRLERLRKQLAALIEELGQLEDSA